MRQQAPLCPAPGYSSLPEFDHSAAQVANVGDSSAVLAELSTEGELTQPGRYLTADHRLTNPEERDRLKGLGIMLGHNGTRLYGLNLGRCLGDRYLKVWQLLDPLMLALAAHMPAAGPKQCRA